MALGLKISQKGLLLVALPSVFEIIFVVILTTLLTQAEHEADAEAHSKEIIACANELTRTTVDATTAAGAYRITMNPLFTERSELAMEMTKRNTLKLKQLLRDKPGRMQDIRDIEKLTSSLMRVVNNLQASDGSDESPGLAGFIGRGRQFQSINRLVNQLGVVTKSVIAEEVKVEQESPKQKARMRYRIRMVLFGGVTLNVVIAIMLAYYFSRSVTKRLLVVRENTERLASRQKLVPAIGGIDEIAELDEAFHKAASRLEELEEFKKQLIGIVSHELKTPLSSMQVNIALMSSGATGELPEKAQRKVSVLESNTNRLIRLINDLLDIEKMEAGKFELELRNCRLSEIVQTSIEAVSEFALKREITLSFDGTDIPVYADHDRIVQVLINFLSNAIKYSEPKSEVKIEIHELSESREVEVKVIDKGRGIPSEFVEKVFDRFQQVDKSDEKVKGGTGLGLAIAKAIIEEHGGAIGVKSTLGEGSTFWFRIKKTDHATGENK